MEIIKQQRFLYEVKQSLKSFWIFEVIDQKLCGQISTCGLIRAYCMILTNLLYLNEDIMLDYHELGIIVNISRYHIYLYFLYLEALSLL